MTQAEWLPDETRAWFRRALKNLRVAEMPDVAVRCSGASTSRRGRRLQAGGLPHYSNLVFPAHYRTCNLNQASRFNRNMPRR
jgi:hypothetical protein